MATRLDHFPDTERARSLLEESEARYRALIEQLPVVAYSATLDEPSTLLYVSPQIEALLGYTPDEFRRNDGIWPDRIHAEDRARVLGELRSCAASGGPFASEYRFLRRDGRAVWLRDDGAVVRGTNGTPLSLQGVIQDITDRKGAERQLAEAQALAHVGSWEWDLVADRIMWSDEHFRIFGLEPQSCPVSYAGTLQYIHPADQATVQRAVAQALRDCQPYGCEFRVLRPDGSERMVEARGKVEVDATGRPIRVHGSAQDVTDHRRADEGLRRSRLEFHDIFAFASVGIFRSSRDGRILLANPEFARILGYDARAQLEALNLARDVYFDPRERETLIAQHEPGQPGWTIEIQWKRRDGMPIWVLLSAHAVKDEAGRLRYFEGFVHDITERRQAAQELARSRKRLRQLAARLEDVREQDRKTIAREIHDELGQALTALRLDLSWIVGRLPPRPVRLAAKTQAMIGVVDQTIAAVRRIATQLRPPILDDLGLVAAIEWQAGETAARTGIRCALELPDEVRLDDTRATAVFRIFQEALTNVVRHAGADSVYVSLRATAEDLTLEVRDDGRGITAAQLSDQGALGLLGMRERAEAVGGMLDVFAGATEGTTVVLRLPVGARAPAEDVP
jgi:PAS domain S-box-containing protein